MTKATEVELAAMHGEIARGLTHVLKEGVPIVVGKGEEQEVIKAPAPAAYYMAAITFAKNNNITADAGTNADLQELNRQLAAKRKAKKLSLTDIETVADQLHRDMGGMTE